MKSNNETTSLYYYLAQYKMKSSYKQLIRQLYDPHGHRELGQLSRAGLRRSPDALI